MSSRGGSCIKKNKVLTLALLACLPLISASCSSSDTYFNFSASSYVLEYSVGNSVEL
jgi:hypothetical protein